MSRDVEQTRPVNENKHRIGRALVRQGQLSWYGFSFTNWYGCLFERHVIFRNVHKVRGKTVSPGFFLGRSQENTPLKTGCNFEIPLILSVSGYKQHIINRGKSWKRIWLNSTNMFASSEIKFLCQVT